jgi:Methylene-tetrahydrofolate reductase C terminal
VETAVHARGALERVGDRPVPTTPGISLPFALALGRALRPNRLWYGLAVWLEATPWAYGAFTFVEKHVKGKLFGCRMCAQCAMPTTAYACPMSCPKQLRNGPCGGVAANGDCEVYPGLRCVWVVAYERAASAGRAADLRRLQRPVDNREWGKSSWVNYWQHRDEGLWTADTSFAAAPPIGTR